MAPHPLGPRLAIGSRVLSRDADPVPPLPGPPFPGNSRRIDRRNLLMGSALLVGAGVAYARTPKITAAPVKTDTFDAMIPKTVGDWSFTSASGLVLPPQDTLSDRLYDDLVTRVYEAPGQPRIMFLAAYNNAQDGVVQVHRPEICYPAGGYRLTETQRIGIASGLGGSLPVRIFSANSVQRSEQVLYWTRVGSDFPQAWSDQRWSVVKSNLRGKVPDGMLVRVSTEMADMGAALPVLSAFVAALNIAMKPDARALFSGIR